MISISEMEAHLTLLGFSFDDDGIRGKDPEYFVYRHHPTYFVFKVTGAMILRTKSYETALRKLFELVTEEEDAMITIKQMEAHLTLLGYIFDDDGIRDRDSEYFVPCSRVMQMDGTWFAAVRPATYFVNHRIDDECAVTILETKNYEIALRKLYELVTIGL